MILIGDQWVAAHQVARIGPHPIADTVCVTLVSGEQIRQNVGPRESKHTVAADLAAQVGEEMRQCKPNASP